MHAGSAVLHTSASLTINENASPDVPLDLNVGVPSSCVFVMVVLNNSPQISSEDACGEGSGGHRYSELDCNHIYV